MNKLTVIIDFELLWLFNYFDLPSESLRDLKYLTPREDGVYKCSSHKCENIHEINVKN